MEGGGKNPVILNLSNRWRSGPASPPGKAPPVPNELESGWAPKPVWTYWRRDKFLACTEIRTLGRPARSLVTAQSSLSRLLLKLVLKWKCAQRSNPLIRFPDTVLVHKERLHLTCVNAEKLHFICCLPVAAISSSQGRRVSSRVGLSTVIHYDTLSVMRKFISSSFCIFHFQLFKYRRLQETVVRNWFFILTNINLQIFLT